ncbi:MAG: hypothetical protein JRI68_13185 [Deltaproteobacteria bacterium]|nr:hypothetical protein [Deltaproteobacteria bacterium]
MGTKISLTRTGWAPDPYLDGSVLTIQLRAKKSGQVVADGLVDAYPCRTPPGNIFYVATDRTGQAKLSVGRGCWTLRTHHRDHTRKTKKVMMGTGPQQTVIELFDQGPEYMGFVEPGGGPRVRVIAKAYGPNGRAMPARFAFGSEVVYVTGAGGALYLAPGRRTIEVTAMGHLPTTVTTLLGAHTSHELRCDVPPNAAVAPPETRYREEDYYRAAAKRHRGEKCINNFHRWRALARDIRDDVRQSAKVKEGMSRKVAARVEALRGCAAADLRRQIAEEPHQELYKYRTTFGRFDTLLELTPSAERAAVQKERDAFQQQYQAAIVATFERADRLLKQRKAREAYGLLRRSHSHSPAEAERRLNALRPLCGRAHLARQDPYGCFERTTDQWQRCREFLRYYGYPEPPRLTGPLRAERRRCLALLPQDF